MDEPRPLVKQYWLHALTPLHVGSGRAIGVVDLPIVREAVTNWPYVPGSAVKGVLADHHEADARAHAWGTLIAEQVFGPGAWYELFLQRFAVVDDDVFSFLAQTATQVDARVRIDEHAKTVAKGQLWYEESLPAETVLAGLAW